jgi:hypothetical protein
LNCFGTEFRIELAAEFAPLIAPRAAQFAGRPFFDCPRPSSTTSSRAAYRCPTWSIRAPGGPDAAVGNVGYNGGMVKRLLTLAILFVATELVAFAVDAASIGSPMGFLIVWFPIPIFLCAAFGTIRGRLRPWLRYGVAIDVALWVATLIWLVVRG